MFQRTVCECRTLAEQSDTSNNTVPYFSPWHDILSWLQWIIDNASDGWMKIFWHRAFCIQIHYHPFNETWVTRVHNTHGKSLAHTQWEDANASHVSPKKYIHFLHLSVTFNCAHVTRDFCFATVPPPHVLPVCRLDVILNTDFPFLLPQATALNGASRLFVLFNAFNDVIVNELRINENVERQHL